MWLHYIVHLTFHELFGHDYTQSDLEADDSFYRDARASILTRLGRRDTPVRIRPLITILQNIPGIITEDATFTRQLGAIISQDRRGVVGWIRLFGTFPQLLQDTRLLSMASTQSLKYIQDEEYLAHIPTGTGELLARDLRLLNFIGDMPALLRTEAICFAGISRYYGVLRLVPEQATFMRLACTTALQGSYLAFGLIPEHFRHDPDISIIAKRACTNFLQQKGQKIPKFDDTVRFYRHTLEQDDPKNLVERHKDIPRDIAGDILLKACNTRLELLAESGAAARLYTGRKKPRQLADERSRIIQLQGQLQRD